MSENNDINLVLSRLKGKYLWIDYRENLAILDSFADHIRTEAWNEAIEKAAQHAENPSAIRSLKRPEGGQDPAHCGDKNCSGCNVGGEEK